jgi:hypothetical protein
LIRQGKARVCREIQDVELASSMGVPYIAGGLMDQPNWFIEVYKIKLKLESENYEREKKYARHKNTNRS